MRRKKARREEGKSVEGEEREEQNEEEEDDEEEVGRKGLENLEGGIAHSIVAIKGSENLEEISLRLPCL